jgi:hypothetical protein
LFGWEQFIARIVGEQPAEA